MKDFFTKHSWIRYQGPALALTLAIFIASSISHLPSPHLGFKLQDKLYHFAAYFVYGILLARAFYFQQRFSQLQKAFVLSAIIFGALYGLSDEFHQFFVPGREMDFFDFLADTLGVMAGAYLFRYALRTGIPVFQK
ncbi:MAG: VanZ family protein [Calditrichia bacterium]